MPKTPEKTPLEKLREFDPNAKPNVTWATYQPRRRQAGSFKLHKHRGHAVNAFHQDALAIIYKWDDEANLWVEQGRKEGPVPKDGSARCYFCGSDGSNLDDFSYYPKFRYDFERDPRNGKILDPLNLQIFCRNCRRR